ncbi:MAG: hypothetical protein OJF59_001792 [Cytophagales bacterium]|jgi:hypothetical protein|nr:hypothetical protein [Bacteroidota bacterium]MBS1950734.1 hypothetical protein [Bacteroidota bacterium]MBS1980706.1 hypothetical protein [Bacteroidota bacterium]WHZ08039.1 MAG: hypothetical protein OJF59_001792 [Cytophagales bacterium]
MRTGFIILALFVASADFAQNKKIKARVSAQYTKVMSQESFIGVSAKYKSDNGFEPVADLEFSIYRKVSDDSLAYIGKTKTDMGGKARFILNADDLNVKEPSTVFTYVAKIENSNKFEDSETTVSFSNAILKAEVQSVDSVNQIMVVLTDAVGNPIPGQAIKVGLKRLFGLLPIGEESYTTDENGSVIVPLKDAMPGISGELIFEVALNESEAYGTVRAIVNSAIGTPIHDQSSFDQRTLWSPPTKTPLYLLVFPGLIILFVWGPILMLMFNLYRISKSK